ncbi:glutaredoxin domain-containing protein [Paenisporosarcina sp. TG-14]|uniref:glutaredoxin domain-containing protein n=1 Tax=Paenisporosarcina sp. TG-14 TaxID=1231057 RepID=UPI001ED98733|nr:glutaredoxin domain-containing protein [Paenisporosarcina sp. TG-14]
MNEHSSKQLLFIVPGCTRCDQVKSKLKESGIPFETVNIFEHRQLLKHVPINIKRQGFPLLKIQQDYYTYNEIINLE